MHRIAYIFCNIDGNTQRGLLTGYTYIFVDMGGNKYHMTSTENVIITTVIQIQWHFNVCTFMVCFDSLPHRLLPSKCLSYKDLLILIVRKYVLRKNIDPAYSMDIVWYSMVPSNMCAITNALSCDQNINVLATDMFAP